MMLVTGTFVVPLLLDDAPTQLRVVSAYASLLLLVGFLVISILFIRIAHESVKRMPLMVGCFLIVGGITFDIAATLIHSPDVAREVNPVARILLGTGHSLALFLFLARLRN